MDKKIYEIASAISTIRDNLKMLGASSPEIKIGLDPDSYNRLTISAYDVYDVGQIYPSDLVLGEHKQLAGAHIVPWIKDR